MHLNSHTNMAPTEIRKRGRRKGKDEKDAIKAAAEAAEQALAAKVAEAAAALQAATPIPEVDEAPAWMLSGPSRVDFDEQAPFGFVDLEVKAYFKTVDDRMQELEEEAAERANKGKGKSTEEDVNADDDEDEEDGELRILCRRAS